MKTFLAEQNKKKMEMKLMMPNTCQCGFKNFYVWGTRINGETHIEVRCMSCGKNNGIVTL